MQQRKPPSVKPSPVSVPNKIAANGKSVRNGNKTRKNPEEWIYDIAKNQKIKINHLHILQYCIILK